MTFGNYSGGRVLVATSTTSSVAANPQITVGSKALCRTPCMPGRPYPTEHHDALEKTLVFHSSSTHHTVEAFHGCRYSLVYFQADLFHAPGTSFVDAKVQRWSSLGFQAHHLPTTLRAGEVTEDGDEEQFHAPEPMVDVSHNDAEDTLHIVIFPQPMCGRVMWLGLVP